MKRFEAARSWADYATALLRCSCRRPWPLYPCLADALAQLTRRSDPVRDDDPKPIDDSSWELMQRIHASVGRFAMQPLGLALVAAARRRARRRARREVFADCALQ